MTPQKCFDALQKLHMQMGNKRPPEAKFFISPGLRAALNAYREAKGHFPTAEEMWGGLIDPDTLEFTLPK